MRVLGRIAAGVALAIALATSSTAQAPAGGAATRGTPEQFAAAASFHGASLSPSGKYLAGIHQEGDQDVLVVIELATNKITPVQRAREADGKQIIWVDWKTDDKLIVGGLYRIEITGRRSTGTHIGADKVVDEAWIPRVLSMARTGGATTPMFEGESHRLAVGYAPITMVSRMPRDPDNILLSSWGPNGLALYRANVTTNRNEKIDQGNWNTRGWVTDVNGAVVLRADGLPRNSGYRFFRRAPGARDWTMFLELKRAAAANSTVFNPLSASPDPGKIYVAARPDNADRAAIYAFDTATGDYGPALLTHAAADLDMPIIDETTNKLLGACADVRRVECVSTDPVVARHLRAIDGFFERSAHFVIAQMSTDQNVWLLAVEEPASPMSYYLYVRDKSAITPITGTRDSLDTVQLATTKTVSYKSRDGTELWGYLTNAPAAGAPPKALIVMPHGGPEARDGSGFDTWAQFLATRGYTVFQPNFRGGAGFGRAFTEAGYRQWGKRMQDDITDGVKHLTSTGVADAARVCIFGWSYGGYAALAGGALTPELYKCVIAGAGPADLPDMLAYERVEEGRGSASYAYWSKAIGDPSADRDALIAVSPRRQAQAFRAPVLLIHGDEDDIVPVAQSRAMNAALREAGKSVRYVELKDEGHHLREYESRVTLYKELDAFLAQHLPPN